MSVPLGDNHIVYPRFRVQETFPRLIHICYEPQSARLPLGDVAPGAYLEIEGQSTCARESKGYIIMGDSQSIHLSCDQTVSWDPDRLPRGERDEVFLLRIAYLCHEPLVKETFLVLRHAINFAIDAEFDMQCFTRVGYVEISRDEQFESNLEQWCVMEEYQKLRLY
jgi:hypothetical protein